MASGMDLGTIYYEVDADTRKLVASGKTVDASLGQAKKAMADTDAGASKLNTRLTATAAAIKKMGGESTAAASSMGGMNKVIGALLTMQGVNALVGMADAYTNLQNRLRLVTSSQEQLAQATQSVFEIAQKSSQAVGTIAEVYQRFAQNADTLGISLNQVADITSTVAKAVAISGASASAAQAALVQFGQGLASGTLRGEELNSVMEQTPALATAIAKGLGITIGELRSLGQEGKITSQALIGALQAAAAGVDEQFSTRVKTVGAAYTELNNSMMKFIGEASTANSASSTLANGLSLVAQNFETVANIVASAGAGALALYISRMTASAVASGISAIAARGLAVEELKLAEANLATATAASANATAMARLTGSHTAAATAANAQAAAEVRLAAAQRGVASIAGTLLGFLGGPVGLVALAATAATGMYLFSGNTDKAADSLVDVTKPLAEVVKHFKALSASQRELTLAQSQADMAKGVRDLDRAYADLAKGSLADGTKAVAQFRAASDQQIRSLVDAAKKGEISFEELDSSIVSLIKNYAAANGRSAEWTQEQIRLASEVSTSALRMQTAEQRAKALADANNTLATSSSNAAASQRDLNNTLSGANTDAGKYLKSLQDRVGGLQDGSSAVKAAQRFLADHTEATEVDRIAILSAAQAADKLVATNAAVKSGLKDSASAAKENAKTIADLKKELQEAKLSGDELAVVRAKNQLNKFATAAEVAKVTELAKAIYQVGEDAKKLENNKAIGDLSVQLGLAGLKARDLAQAQAELKLNEYATPEQVAQARAIAAATWDLADAEAKRKAFTGDDELNAPKAVYDKVRGKVEPLKGGEFDEQAARYEAERKAELARYAQQQDDMLKAQALNLEIKGGYFVLEEQLAQEHADRMAQIENAKNTLMLKAGEKGFGAVADAMKASFGEQNALYKAAFIAQKAFAIAQSVIAIQQGIALAAANPFPLNLAAMASVAAATAGLISNITSVTMGSGRRYGGDVAPGSMHRVNENGKPEVMNAANGQQFLIPNTRGKVISADDAASGNSNSGPMNLTVNLIEDASRAGQVEQTQTGGQTTVNAFVKDIRGRGPMAQTFEETYDLKRRGK